MAQLTPTAISEFKEVYREEFSEEITDDRAVELGGRLIQMMKIIYRPIDSAKEITLK